MKDGGLQGVHAGVCTFFQVHVFIFSPMVCYAADAGDEVGVVAADGPGIAEGTEVFCGEETVG